ncbi:C40 family peptidase [Streptomyces sp. CB01881]|uniref:C40 family peptidase n=1 Tax=Streptomyces sp. CB01881 TaxID=2078691 RepID=UPI0011DF4B81|nr:C40 family peptidase [Streptomyces sp. CB01881]TYC77202.1 NlpC/P60 family protein [Streptomyces sp. CB01881]
MTTVNTGAPGAADDETGQHATTSDGRTRAARPSRAARVRRGIAMVAVIAAGSGVIGLGTSVGSAAAEPAPAHAGWDGSRYWFKNSQGQWRWTSHYDIYKARTGGSSTSAAKSSSSSSGGIKQGWDGSRYWFRNSQGEWRWTSHYDIYLDRTGGSSSGSSGSSSGSSSGASADSAEPAEDGDVETAVQFALAQLGKPFVTAGNGPNGYDCSGLVQQAFRRGGIDLPRVANDQYAATTPVRASQLRRGDLLFWSPDGTARGIQHVAIYLGNNQYVEAARPGTSIRISGISSGYYPAFMGRP